MVMSKVKVKLVRSPIGYDKKQRKTLIGLGVKKINSEKILENTPSVRGMIAKVSHLVEVEIVSST